MRGITKQQVQQAKQRLKTLKCFQNNSNANQIAPFCTNGEAIKPLVVIIEVDNYKESLNNVHKPSAVTDFTVSYFNYLYFILFFKRRNFKFHFIN